ncbi:MAG: FimB/Mfa2 family fimbrial subunit, partial [Bacteroidaceae bacterium]
LTYKGKSNVTLVAWGNLSSDSINVPSLAVGEDISALSLSLNQNSEGYSTGAPDLYSGVKDSLTESLSGGQNQVIELQMKSRVATLKVTANNLQKIFGTSSATVSSQASVRASDDYYIEVRSPYNQLSFSGEPQGDPQIYLPNSSFNSSDSFSTNAFHIIPGGKEPLELFIFKGNTELFSTTTDSSGLPLILKAGESKKIEITFTKLNVVVQILPWTTVSQDVSY